jgi:hypothetical protein
MERLFRVKEDSRILILNADEIVYRDEKPCVCMRSLVNKNGGYTPGNITVEYKEVEEIQIFESDDGSYVISKKV